VVVVTTKNFNIQLLKVLKVKSKIDFFSKPAPVTSLVPTEASPEATFFFVASNTVRVPVMPCFYHKLYFNANAGFSISVPSVFPASLLGKMLIVLRGSARLNAMTRLYLILSLFLSLVSYST
jgi:hypothetical protein